MDPITLAMIALKIIVTKATEKVGETFGEGVITSTKNLLEILRRKSPNTVKRLESSSTKATDVIDAEIIKEVQRLAEVDPEVQVALDVVSKAMQQQFGGVINQGKLAEKIGFVFQGGYNPVQIDKFELWLESSGEAPTNGSTQEISQKDKLIAVVAQEEKRLKSHIVSESSSISRILESVSLTGTTMPDSDIWIAVPTTILSGGKSVLRRHQQNSAIRKAAKINSEMARKALLSISNLKDSLLREDLDAAIIALQKYTPPVFKVVKGYGQLKPYWILHDED